MLKQTISMHNDSLVYTTSAKTTLS